MAASIKPEASPGPPEGRTSGIAHAPPRLTLPR